MLGFGGHFATKSRRYSTTAKHSKPSAVNGTAPASTSAVRNTTPPITPTKKPPSSSAHSPSQASATAAVATGGLRSPQPPKLARNDRPPRKKRMRHHITRIGGRKAMNVVIYTVEEAAQVLKISRWKVFELIRTKQLRSVKIGGLRRIPGTAIEEYITRLMEEVA
jgi:excisionase family DNA binding protein